MKTRSLLAFTAAALLLMAGCGSDDQADTQISAAGIEHVHGLGIDPADNNLYAATHTGLFRVVDRGRARRVADSYQDTMGFTVVGPNHFLGSGHPDLSTDLPPLLGLIETTNAGRDWQPLSLLGDADFHALSFRHGAVHGYDATNERFMVSIDRKTWDTRSQPSGVISLAVDPDDPEHVLATSTEGLLSSSDGGRTWATSSSPLALVSWADDGTLAGASLDGRISTSSDAGATWVSVGQLPGPPEALLSVDRNHSVGAVQERGIYESNDGGTTWRLRYRDRT